MRKYVKGLAWVTGVILVIVGAARATAIRWWRVPTNDPFLEASVTPSLRAGDWILLWRASKPELGDLVMCDEPGAPDRVIVGRLVGLDGNTVDIQNGALTLDGKFSGTERGCGSFVTVDPKTGNEIKQTCSEEVFRGSTHKRGNILNADQRVGLKVSRVVAAGQGFLLSDNREFPYDSRDFGPVDIDTCKETVIFRLWGRLGYFSDDQRFEFIK